MPSYTENFFHQENLKLTLKATAGLLTWAVDVDAPKDILAFSASYPPGGLKVVYTASVKIHGRFLYRGFIVSPLGTFDLTAEEAQSAFECAINQLN